MLRRHNHSGIVPQDRGTEACSQLRPTKSLADPNAEDVRQTGIHRSEKNPRCVPTNDATGRAASPCGRKSNHVCCRRSQTYRPHKTRSRAGPVTLAGYSDFEGSCARQVSRSQGALAEVFEERLAPTTGAAMISVETAEALVLMAMYSTAHCKHCLGTEMRDLPMELL